MSAGLVHVGDELREVNGNLITHKRPEEISQILVTRKHVGSYKFRCTVLVSLVVYDDSTALFCDQSQSQGSITLKIIPAVAEEDLLKESRVRTPS